LECKIYFALVWFGVQNLFCFSLECICYFALVWSASVILLSAKIDNDPWESQGSLSSHRKLKLERKTNRKIKLFCDGPFSNPIDFAFSQD